MLKKIIFLILSIPVFISGSYKETVHFTQIDANNRRLMLYLANGDLTSMKGEILIHNADPDFVFDKPLLMYAIDKCNFKIFETLFCKSTKTKDLTHLNELISYCEKVNERYLALNRKYTLLGDERKIFYAKLQNLRKISDELIELKNILCASDDSLALYYDFGSDDDEKEKKQESSKKRRKREKEKGTKNE